MTGSILLARHLVFPDIVDAAIHSGWRRPCLMVMGGQETYMVHIKPNSPVELDSN